MLITQFKERSTRRMQLNLSYQCPHSASFWQENLAIILHILSMTKTEEKRTSSWSFIFRLIFQFSSNEGICHHWRRNNLFKWPDCRTYNIIFEKHSFRPNEPYDYTQRSFYFISFISVPVNCTSACMGNKWDAYIICITSFLYVLIIVVPNMFIFPRV